MKKILCEINDPKEKLFIKKVLEHCNKAEFQGKAFFTDFYNRVWMEQTIIKHIGLSHLFEYEFFGGYDSSERQVLGIFPAYDTNHIFPISCLEIRIKTGIGKALSHRDFLGAFLGLGIQRDMIGDIIIKPFGSYVIIQSHIIEYVSATLTSIGKYKNITIEEISFLELDLEAPQTREIHTTVASLRIDAVASAGFGVSRTICARLIQNDKAKCNGIEISPSYSLKEGDVITLRGHGKIKLEQVSGTTKKDRIHICITKYI